MEEVSVYDVSVGNGHFIAEGVVVHNCDTWYAWRGDTKEYYREPFDIPIDELEDVILIYQTRKGVEEGCAVKNVTFTGGEPLMQQNAIQEWMVKNPDWMVQIETNGTIMPNDYLLEHAYWNCSPKLGCSGNKVDRRFQKAVVEAITKSINAPCFKFVVENPEDIDETLDVYGSLIPREQIYIMPEGVTKEESTATYAKINDKLIALGLNTTPRLQNIMFDGAKRGV